MGKLNYRKQIYEKYPSLMHNSVTVEDKNSLASWCNAFGVYTKGWLPPDINAAILDVGCGSGRLLHFFKNKGYKKLHGIDISAEQVMLAKKIIDNVEEGDAIDFLESNRERFDLVVGLDIIEHFKKNEVLTFLEACYGSLRKGGRLILQTPNAESPWGLRYHDLTHEIAFDPLLLERLLNLKGYSNIKFREAGPVIHGILSSIRFIIWKLIKTILVLWNFAETGSKGSGVYTRVFLISGVKKVK